MKRSWWKLLVVVLLVVVVAVVIAAKNKSSVTVVSKPSQEDAASVKPNETSKNVGVKDMPQETSADEKPSNQNDNRIEKKANPAAKTESKDSIVSETKSQQPAAKPKAERVNRHLPKLLDLGADKCIPCKMMAPILEELASEYKGKLEVVFIDVWQNPNEAEKYGIQSIPTQIFFDENGREFYRHIGYISKEDIVAVFEDHGIKLR